MQTQAEPLTRRLLARLLRDHGMEVTLCRNGGLEADTAYLTIYAVPDGGLWWAQNAGWAASWASMHDPLSTAEQARAWVNRAFDRADALFGSLPRDARRRRIAHQRILVRAGLLPRHRARTLARWEKEQVAP